MLAAFNGNVGMVRLLVQRGAKLSLTSRDGDKAIDYAREFNHPEVVALLEAACARAAAAAPRTDPTSRGAPSDLTARPAASAAAATRALARGRRW